MGDTFDNHGLRKNSNVTSVITNKKVSNGCMVASSPKSFSQKSPRPIISKNHKIIGSGPAGEAALFLLKVALLEIVRRFSRRRFPFVWCGMRALQVLCYPPFKWIQRWVPFKGLVNSMQTLSRNVTSIPIDDSQGLNDSEASSESHSELSPVQSTLDTRILDEAPQSQSSTDWLLQLYAELENQGIVLPESGQELEMWSNMVFWHGIDIKYRPCLIVRLGLAGTSLPSHEIPRFVQAVVSQVEHGILHLVDPENSRITVIVDCKGLSPLRVPMQLMRSCSAIFQDHYPNRLGFLFVIRLPPIVRVIAQTFIKVLKPETQQKLKIQGEKYQKLLTENLKTLPAYLGGNCTCTRCSNLNISKTWLPRINKVKINGTQRKVDIVRTKDASFRHLSYPTDMRMNGNCDQVFQTIVVGILIFWVLIAFVAGIYDPESSQTLPSYSKWRPECPECDNSGSSSLWPSCTNMRDTTRLQTRKQKEREELVDESVELPALTTDLDDHRNTSFAVCRQHVCVSVQHRDFFELNKQVPSFVICIY
ncbi:unnamed protein product [Camellia sinensis]